MEKSNLIKCAIVLCGLLLCGCSVANKVTPNETVIQNVSLRGAGHDINKGAECAWVILNGAWLPDPSCSPGDAFPLEVIQINGKYAKEPGGVIVGDICVSGYSDNIRDVDQSTKEAVYKEYGVFNRTTNEYEIDHIIPLSIGGTNDIKNLFPQPAMPRPGFHQKDICETCFKRMICNGELNITEAQFIMAKNWTRCLSMCNVR
jgi:hypothetical protein